MDYDLRAEEITDWFKNHEIRDHQLIYQDGTTRTEVLTWGNKNGSSIYRVDYMLRHGCLAVYGDLGEAVYRWGEVVSLDWIAGLNLGYFRGKCTASESGRIPSDWDEKEAKESIRWVLRDRIKSDCIDIDYYKETEGAKKELRRFLNCCYNKQEMEHLFHDGDPVLAFDDEEWYEWLPECGNVTPCRIQSHLIGLKMAFNKFKTKGR